MSEMTRLEVRGTDRQVDDDPVRDVQRDFPHYRTWCEMAGARAPRYVAQARGA